MTFTSHCVDALIGGNDVAMMLVTFKGHCLLRRAYHRSTPHYLSVCLSALSSLFVKDNAPDLMHQQYVSAFAWQGGGGLLACHSPLNNLPVIYP